MIWPFVNTLTLWQWGLLALIPPAILALYFLKLRRQPLAVPSTYLWSKAIEDLHVNSLWQRLRQSLLLLLQLLLIALLAFTLLRPGWRGTDLSGHRFVLLIDTSASMGATDVSPTRLDEAKRQARNLVDQMKAGDVAMLISFSSAARVEQPFTDNRRLLRTKIDLIEQTVHTSDLSEALRAASGLANPGESGDPNNPLDPRVAEALPATLYLFTDGGFQAVPDFNLGQLDPKYQKVAGETFDNAAITAFSTESNPDKPDQLQAFGRIENFSNEERKLEATLLLNDVLLDVQAVDLPARGDQGVPGVAGVKFDLQQLEAGVLRLEINSKDNLKADNQAFAVVSLPRPAKVLLITPGNDALELSMATDEMRKVAAITVQDPKFLDTKAYQEASLEGSFDLIIFDQCAPKQLPLSNTLFIGTTPPGEDWKLGEKQNVPLVVDVDAVHPLTQLVRMNNVKIVEGRPIDKRPQGSTILIEADSGPLLVVGPRAGYEDAVLGIEIVGAGEGGELEAKTDWPIRRSFPVFVMNAVKYLGGVRSSVAAPSVRPGNPAVLRSITPVPLVVVETPRGDAFDVPRETQNTFVFGRTDELGVYQVREGTGAKAAQQFAVNLYDSRESDLTPRETLDIGHEEVKAEATRQVARQELWRWLLLGAIGLVLFEWYVYNKRVYL
jgi:hypothetical protein